MTQEQITGLEPVNFAYDTRGRLTTVIQGTGPDTRTYSLTYNSQGYIGSITDPLLRSVSFEYDLAGRVTKQILPDSREINYTYDANGNVTLITPPGRAAHGFNYTAETRGQIFC